MDLVHVLPPAKGNQMRLTRPEIRNDTIATFRLQRHHLLDDDGEGADAVTICRDMCGVQAQVMSAAYLQILGAESLAYAKGSGKRPVEVAHAGKNFSHAADATHYSLR